VPQVVAAGVFDQAPVEIEQIAAPGHHLQPGHPVAGQAVAHDFDAAGVGGDIAADLAGAARGKVHRVIQTLLAGEVLYGFGDRRRPGK
jgi:hypothetical protein